MKWNRIFFAMTVSAVGLTAMAEWKPAPASLTTRWGKQVTPENAWRDVYPRPTLQRERWMNLNGLWDLAINEKADSAEPEFDRQILVPYPVESSLSGVGETCDRAVYRRKVTIPADWKGERVLLNFDAVDYQTSVTVNGTLVKTLDGEEEHLGGYTRFTYDITDALKGDGEQEIVVSVVDPSDQGPQPRGKQVTKPHGIWYTPSTGIWQTVWLEPVSAKGALRSVRFTPSAANGSVNIKVDAVGDETNNVEAVIKSGDEEVAQITFAASEETEFVFDSPKLWTTDAPHLYSVEVRLKNGDDVLDMANSYFGLRDITMRNDGYFQRIYLNDKEIFQTGPLDQGFWPESLHTPPSHEAMIWDIDYTHELGFNMIRKHIKVEPETWYHHCDKTGMLVWQDAVNGSLETPEAKAVFEQDLERMIENHWNHPSIVLWVVFNEEWGQYDTERLTKWTKEKDPHRLVTNASGWVDKKVGDILDMHCYPGPGALPPDPYRANVLGEFGGLGLFVEGHSWSEKHWGYQGMSDREELYTRFAGIMKGLPYLRYARGLCASVYTQTTDVEIEANGIVTYDREVKKIDSEKVKALNDAIINARPIRILADTSLSEEDQLWQTTTAKPADDWMSAGFDDSVWATRFAGFGSKHKRYFGELKTAWTTDDIWLRRTVYLPDDVKPANVEIIMTHVDDAEVYINGVLAVKAEKFNSGYEPFKLSDDALKTLRPGAENTIAVHCRNVRHKDEEKETRQYIDVGLIETLTESE